MKRKLLPMVLLLSAAFAATADVTITYQSVGNDTYQDGTTVLAGETYALVWTASETFDGFNADATLKNGTDRLLQFTNNASKNKKTGKMGLNSTQVQISDADAATFKTAGYLYVVLLDTRNADGTLTERSDPPLAINGYEAKGKVAVPAGLQTASASATQGIVITCVSSIPDGTPTSPVVKRLYFEGDGEDRKMVMVVTNTASFLRYTSGDVALGSASSPKTDGAVPANGGATSADEIVITVPATNANSRLYRIIRN